MVAPKLRFREFEAPWVEHPLGDLANLSRGKFSIRPRNDPKYFGGDIPFIQTGDIVKSGIYVETYTQTLNKLGESISKIFPSGTIMITIAANIGDLAILKHPMACPDSLVGIEVKSNISNNLWLMYSLSLKKDELDANATQNAQKNINLQVLNALNIFAPSYIEQTKIANFLSAVDKRIQQLSQTHALLVQYKKGVMQKIFSQELRFKDENGEEFGEWEAKKLGDISSPRQWPTISASEMTDNGYPVYGANGYIGFYKKYNHEIKTIAVTCRGNTCGEIALTMPYTYITGNSMSIDDLDEEIVGVDYLFYSLKFRGFKDIISGSAQPQIVGSAIKKVNFSLPTLPEQTKIANFLSAIDDKINQAQSQLSALQEYKRGLLQQMFI